MLGFLWASRGDAAEVRVGPTAGATVSSRRVDQSVGRATLLAVFGRTPLFGALVDVSLDRHVSIGLDLTVGPYSNDRTEGCAKDLNNPLPCEPTPTTFVSHAFLWNVQGSYRFGANGLRPYVLAGVGGKRYTYDRPFNEATDRTSGTLTLGLGLERGGKIPIVIDGRALLVLRHPFIYQSSYRGRSNVEAQVRIGVLFPLGS